MIENIGERQMVIKLLNPTVRSQRSFQGCGEYSSLHLVNNLSLSFYYSHQSVLLTLCYQGLGLMFGKNGTYISKKFFN